MGGILANKGRIKGEFNILCIKALQKQRVNKGLIKGETKGDFCLFVFTRLLGKIVVLGALCKMLYLLIYNIY